MRPELRGVLYHADHHLTLAKRFGRGYRADARRRRHWSKVQKLVTKAVRLMTAGDLAELAAA